MRAATREGGLAGDTGGALLPGHYSRGRQWLLSELAGGGAVLALPAIRCEVPLAEIDRDGAFRAQPALTL
jgi:hypothetical protein